MQIAEKYKKELREYNEGTLILLPSENRLAAENEKLGHAVQAINLEANSEGEAKAVVESNTLKETEITSMERSTSSSGETKGKFSFGLLKTLTSIFRTPKQLSSLYIDSHRISRVSRFPFLKRVVTQRMSKILHVIKCMRTSISVTKCPLALALNFNIACERNTGHKKHEESRPNLLHKMTRNSDPTLRNNPNTNANHNGTNRYFRLRLDGTFRDIYQNVI